MRHLVEPGDVAVFALLLGLEQLALQLLHQPEHLRVVGCMHPMRKRMPTQISALTLEFLRPHVDLARKHFHSDPPLVAQKN